MCARFFSSTASSPACLHLQRAATAAPPRLHSPLSPRAGGRFQVPHPAAGLGQGRGDPLLPQLRQRVLSQRQAVFASHARVY